MTSPYGLDQAQMQSIINQTNDALSQMTTLNGTVQARADDIYSHAQSDAGRILQQRLNTWNTDFRAIINALSELNDGVQQWLQTNVGTGSGAAGAAGGQPPAERAAVAPTRVNVNHGLEQGVLLPRQYGLPNDQHLLEPTRVEVNQAPEEGVLLPRQYGLPLDQHLLEPTRVEVNQAPEEGVLLPRQYGLPLDQHLLEPTRVEVNQAPD